MRPTFMSSATTLANIPGTSSLRNCLSSTGWLSPASLAASCRKHTAGHCTKRQSHSGRRSWPGEMAQGDLAKGPWEPKLATSPGPLVGFVHCPRGNECLHNSFSGNTINDFKICKRWFREQVLRRAKRRVVCRRILSFLAKSIDLLAKTSADPPAFNRDPPQRRSSSPRISATSYMLGIRSGKASTSGASTCGVSFVGSASSSHPNRSSMCSRCFLRIYIYMQQTQAVH